MRDITTIDHDLRLQAKVRSSLREQDGATATSLEIDQQIDDLLDERLDLLLN